MRPGANEVLHFSEDPGIGRFVPHVARTAHVPEAYVWAVGGDRVPCYWFPRQCPRGTAWATAATTPADRVRVFGSASVGRVHAVEYGWLEAMRTNLWPFWDQVTASTLAFSGVRLANGRPR